MSHINYQVLARKYRPKSFANMIGQEHVLRPVINALNKQRLHHAYLLTGPHGIGKTTIARIIAKCLNCETGISANPCDECTTCKEIDAGNFIDLLEVDAASRTKVEDTRELLDNVQYLPTHGRYKIYLIDEVHMLSNHSFNALLKTLEEPPPHVKFLLATTDAQKLPATVLSRCLQFHLKKLSPEIIADYLQIILEQEAITFEIEALQQIAKAANGSVRDSLSLLDQAIAFSQGKITALDTSAMLGTIEQIHVQNILQALAQKDGTTLLDLTQQLAELAVDFGNVLEEIITTLHSIAITQVIPAIDSNPKIIALSKLFSREDVQLYYQIALLGRRDLPLTPNPKQGFEITLLRMLAFQPTSNTSSATTNKILTKKHNLKTNQSTQPTVTTANNNSVKTSATNITKNTISDWNDFLEQLNLSGMTYALATNCSCKTVNATNIELVLNKNHAALLNPKVKQRLNAAINQHLKQNLALSITISDTNINNTPAAITAQKQAIKHQNALNTIKSDPNVQSMIKQFGAIVEPSLVTPEDKN